MNIKRILTESFDSLEIGMEYDKILSETIANIETILDNLELENKYLQERIEILEQEKYDLEQQLVGYE